MADDAEIKGLEDVANRLNKALADVRGATVGGLKVGAMIILAQAQRYVPVEYGNLKASGYIQPLEDGSGWRIGFSAAYAVYVHENMEQKLKGKPRPSGLGVYWGPSGRPKYLQTAAAERMDDVVEAVRARARSE